MSALWVTETEWIIIMVTKLINSIFKVKITGWVLNLTLEHENYFKIHARQLHLKYSVNEKSWTKFGFF